MTLLEPPIDRVEPAEEVAAPLTDLRTSFVTTICDVCRRRVIQLDGVWRHVDPAVDQPTNPDVHEAKLFVETPVRWGFLNEPKPHMKIEG